MLNFGRKSARPTIWVWARSSRIRHSWSGHGILPERMLFILRLENLFHNYQKTRAQYVRQSTTSRILISKVSLSYHQKSSYKLNFRGWGNIQGRYGENWRRIERNKLTLSWTWLYLPVDSPLIYWSIISTKPNKLKQCDESYLKLSEIWWS